MKYTATIVITVLVICVVLLATLIQWADARAVDNVSRETLSWVINDKGC